MGGFEIWDSEGIAHYAILNNGVPEVEIEDHSSLFPDFSFLVKFIENGNVYWVFNRREHRVGKPAVEYANGDKEWLTNGRLHRLDGPAIEYSSGNKYWYVDDKIVSKCDYLKAVEEFLASELKPK